MYVRYTLHIYIKTRRNKKIHIAKEKEYIYINIYMYRDKEYVYSGESE